MDLAVDFNRVAHEDGSNPLLVVAHRSVEYNTIIGIDLATIRTVLQFGDHLSTRWVLLLH